MPGSAQITFVEGQLAISSDQSDNVIAVFGHSSLGVVGQYYDFDGATPAQVKTSVGVGKGPQLVSSILSTPNHGRVIYVPLAFTSGVASAVTAGGTAPPTVTLTGTPVDDAELRVEILTGGARGTATFRYSLDGARNWSGEFYTAATFLIPDTGVTLNYAVGTYVGAGAGQSVYSATFTAPTISNTQITDGIQVVQDAGLEFGIGYIVSANTGATDTDRATAMAGTFAAVGAKADAFEASDRYVAFVIEAPSPVDPTTPSGLSAWRAALVAASPALANERVFVAAGYVRRVSDMDGWQLRRSGGWSIAEKLSVAPISEHLGRVRSGSLRSIVSLEHNESTTGGLELSRYITLCTHSGRNGFYVATPSTFATATSDYNRVHRLRVANAGAKALREGLMNYVNDSVQVAAATGRITEDEAKAVDSDLTARLAAVLLQPGHASSVAARVSRTDNILSTSRMTGEGAVQPLGYAEKITFRFGYTRTTASA